MQFWWVNHKQTFTREIEGGYVWSPKTNKNKSRNETYLNLTRTTPGDIVFSYAGGKIKCIGYVINQCREARKPLDFGKAGDSWADEGWLVEIAWHYLDQPITPKDHIAQIAPLLPERNSPIRSNGDGIQSCYLAKLSSELGHLLVGIAKLDSTEFQAEAEEHILNHTEDVEEAKIREQPIAETEKDQLVKARRGQGAYRMNLERVEHCCRVTGVKDKRFLIASHIKPWKDSSNAERLDGNNGLLLSPHIDKLFDKGWISFSDDGELLISCPEIEQVLREWGTELHRNVGKFSKKQANYLKYHRETIYRANRNTEPSSMTR